MDILGGKVKTLYFKYLVAASGSSMIASIFGMIDAMMVGKYHGPSGNAALAVFNPLWCIIYSLGLLAGIGGSVLFATSRGKGDEKAAQQYFTLSIFYGIGLTILAMIGIGLFHESLFRFFGADAELMVLTKKYLTPIFFAIRAVCLVIFCRRIFAMTVTQTWQPRQLSLVVYSMHLEIISVCLFWTWEF